MGERDAGLTLEALAQRLETLERENTELRDEVSALRSSGTRREGPAETSSLVARREGQRASGFEGVVSRRALLSKAGAAAVAAMAAGTLLYPRQAKAHDLDVTAAITPDYVTTHFVEADNHVYNSTAIRGVANTSILDGAVEGENHGYGPAVFGLNYPFDGGTGNGPGVLGRASGSGAEAAGVRGINDKGYGVVGEGKTGVWGLSQWEGYAANYGQNTYAGWGVVGDGMGAAYSGVMGRSDTGSGVRGESTSGYGGHFEGGKAQLRLKPGGSAGKPGGAHAKGEIYMDSRGALFVCTLGGSPGTWKKLSATAV